MWKDEQYTICIEKLHNFYFGKKFGKEYNVKIDLDYSSSMYKNNMYKY